MGCPECCVVDAAAECVCSITRAHHAKHIMQVSAREDKHIFTATINNMRAYTGARVPIMPSSCTNMLCQLTCTFMLHQAAAMVTQKDMLHAHLNQCAFRLFTYPVDGSVWVSVSKTGLLHERCNAHTNLPDPSLC